jgi:hypothetical protein
MKWKILSDFESLLSLEHQIIDGLKCYIYCETNLADSSAVALDPSTRDQPYLELAACCGYALLHLVIFAMWAQFAKAARAFEDESWVPDGVGIRS